MNAKAFVCRILRSSIVDGPGNRAVVFVQGCNYNCMYCHNPETIARPSTDIPTLNKTIASPVNSRFSHTQQSDIVGAERSRSHTQQSDIVGAERSRSHTQQSDIVGASPRLMTAVEAFAEIEPSLAFIRGITVSGGECTLYPEFLLELAQIAHEHSLDFFLDSNGSYDFAVNSPLLNVVDSVMLDIKADPNEPIVYEKITGQNNKQTIESVAYESPTHKQAIEPAACEKEIDHVQNPINDGKSNTVFDYAKYLAEQNKLWEIRTVVSPGLFDAEALVEKVCSHLHKAENLPIYKLIRYRPNGVRQEYRKILKVPDTAYMDRLVTICEGYGIKTVVV
jgi:pyruvate formate lyase activating enzyme